MKEFKEGNLFLCEQTYVRIKMISYIDCVSHIELGMTVLVFYVSYMKIEVCLYC